MNDSNDEGGLHDHLKKILQFTKFDLWIEIASIVLLFIATISSAWVIYMAQIWNGVQSSNNALMAQSLSNTNRITSTSNQLLAIDVGLFVQYYAAILENRKEFASALYRRFRPEFKKAVDAWLLTDPWQNPLAPQGPFVMDEYKPRLIEEAKQYFEKAKDFFKIAENASFLGNNYISINIFFTLIIFFAGVIPKFRSRSIRMILVVIAYFVCLFAFIMIYRIN